jgi:hypothetical protein
MVDDFWFLNGGAGRRMVSTEVGATFDGRGDSTEVEATFGFWRG